MPTSLSEGFAEFRSNLEITDLQAPVVATRQQRVREAMEANFDVRDSFLTGSYARHTMIAPLTKADVDVFVVLGPQYHVQHTPASLLDAVRLELRETYPKTPRVSKNGQAVTITFNDFLLDVVPGFYREGGGYLIGDAGRGKWIPTNPKRHVELWSESNDYHQGEFVPFVKMIKAWNRGHSSTFRSFHLETMIRCIFATVSLEDLPSAIRHFFAEAQEKVTYQLKDPAGFNHDVGAYMTGTVLEEAKQRLIRAEEWALRAEVAIADDLIDLAFDQYRLIFGDYFPAYG